MKELGEYLRRTRISNGVSITEACEDLDFSTSHLENIESGNVRAFKDVYELRDSVKNYAKYLGLDSDKVVDEFNGFLFQHTSKITLDDIRAAQKKKEELLEENNFHAWPIFYAIIAILLVAMIAYIILSNINKVPERVDELRIGVREEIIL